jgi:hypothetical protein
LHHVEHRRGDVDDADIAGFLVYAGGDRCAAGPLPDDQDVLRVRMQ